ncbi:hypothetical protein TKK_0001072 [Trichogramma kaykai]
MHMDMSETMASLNILVEKKLKVSLTVDAYYLQGIVLIEDDKTLVNQCKERSGIFQVKLHTEPNQKQIFIVLKLFSVSDFLIQHLGFINECLNKIRHHFNDNISSTIDSHPYLKINENWGGMANKETSEEIENIDTDYSHGMY